MNNIFSIDTKPEKCFFPSLKIKWRENVQGGRNNQGMPSDLRALSESLVRRGQKWQRFSKWGNQKMVALTSLALC